MGMTKMTKPKEIFPSDLAEFMHEAYEWAAQVCGWCGEPLELGVTHSCKHYNEKVSQTMTLESRLEPPQVSAPKIVSGDTGWKPPDTIALERIALALEKIVEFYGINLKGESK